MSTIRAHAAGQTSDTLDMVTRPAQPVPPTFRSGYSVEILTAFAFLFVLQAGLMPLDFDPHPAGAAGSFFDARPYDLIVPDIVSNLALYFPLGALVCWTLDRRLGQGLIAAIATVIFCAFVSVCIEYAQAFSPSRVSSLIDVTSNIIGASVGACCSWMARRLIPRFTTAAMLELRDRPHAAALKAYCAILVIFAAVPFSFSFDFGGLTSAVKSANVVPFASTTWGGGYMESSAVRAALGASPANSTGSEPDAQAARSATTDPFRSAPYAAWFAARRWSRWTAEAASFFLLVALLIPVLRKDYGFTFTASLVLTIWISALMASLLSVMQLFIISRGFDVTDVLLRIAGAALGLLVWSRHTASEHRIKGRRFSPAQPDPRRWRKVAQLGCLGSVMYILYTGVIPLTYTWDWDRVRQSVSAPEFVPFYAYFTGRFDLMLADFIEKLAAYALCGALVVAFFRQDRQQSLRSGLAAALAVCLPLSLVIETLQVFNPIRVTSLTDPIVAVVGAILGVLAQDQALRFYRSARSLTVIAPGTGHDAAPAATVTELSSLDELIATLAEPDEAAPAEPHPHPPAEKPTTRD